MADGIWRGQVETVTPLQVVVPRLSPGRLYSPAVIADGLSLTYDTPVLVGFLEGNADLLVVLATTS